VKTEELLSLLSARLEPVDRGRSQWRFFKAWGMGLMGSLALTAGVLRVNAALSAELRLPMFWVRAAFCASLALAAVAVLRRLARPGIRQGFVPVTLVMPILAMWVLALAALAHAPSADRQSLVLGHTARVCPWLIALLAVPLFATLIWAVRGFAPTRLRLAGAATGFAAGAGGALAYTLHCPELAAPFLGLWYLLGMLIPTAIGALVGPHLLRW